MALLKIRNLGQYGVISGLLPIDLPLNAFTDALNVRFRNGKIESYGGWTNIVPEMNDASVQNYTVIRRPLADSYFFAGKNKIQSLDIIGNTFTVRDITPASHTYDIDPNTAAWENNNYKWTGGVINELIYFNQPTVRPIGQSKIDDTTSPLVELPGWGKPKHSAPTEDYDWRCQRIASYKSYLMALGMWEKAQASDSVRQHLPNRVRWSNLAMEGELPQDWIEDDEAKDGGFVDLIDATSDILDGLPLRDNMIVYTGSETYRFSYVGGRDIFSNYKVFPDTGILNPGCAVEFESKHFVVSTEDIFVHNGETKQSVVEGRIKERLFREISKINYKACRVYAYPSQKEIWITYPYNIQAQGTLPNEQVWFSDRAAVWNWQDDTWTFIDLPNGFDYSTGRMTPNTDIPWNDTVQVPDTRTWDIEPTPNVWDNLPSGIGGDHLYAITNKHSLMIMDYGNTKDTVVFPDPTAHPKQYSISKTDVYRMAMRRGIDFDQEADSSFSKKLLKGLFPQVDGTSTGTLVFSVGGCDVNGGSLVQDNSVVFDNDAQYRLGVFSNQRYHFYRIEDGNHQPWVLSGLDVDVSITSRR